MNLKTIMCCYFKGGDPIVHGNAYTNATQLTVSTSLFIRRVYNTFMLFNIDN